jgi:hypothetical protein
MATVVIVMTMLMAAGLVYWHRRTLLYYLSANYMPRKIAAITPVAHTLDEHDQEEEGKGELHEGSDSDDGNGSHWSWSGSDSEAAGTYESSSYHSYASHETDSEQSHDWIDDGAMGTMSFLDPGMSFYHPAIFAIPDQYISDGSIFYMSMLQNDMALFMPDISVTEILPMQFAMDPSIYPGEYLPAVSRSNDDFSLPNPTDSLALGSLEQDGASIANGEWPWYNMPLTPSQMMDMPVDESSDDASETFADSSNNSDEDEHSSDSGSSEETNFELLRVTVIDGSLSEKNGTSISNLLPLPYHANIADGGDWVTAEGSFIRPVESMSNSAGLAIDTELPVFPNSEMVQEENSQYIVDIESIFHNGDGSLTTDDFMMHATRSTVGLYEVPSPGSCHSYYEFNYPASELHQYQLPHQAMEWHVYEDDSPTLNDAMLVPGVDPNTFPYVNYNIQQSNVDWYVDHNPSIHFSNHPLSMDACQYEDNFALNFGEEIIDTVNEFPHSS